MCRKVLAMFAPRFISVIGSRGVDELEMRRNGLESNVAQCSEL
jgi:hypothetical protein